MFGQLFDATEDLIHRLRAASSRHPHCSVIVGFVDPDGNPIPTFKNSNFVSHNFDSDFVARIARPLRKKDVDGPEYPFETEGGTYFQELGFYADVLTNTSYIIPKMLLFSTLNYFKYNEPRGSRIPAPNETYLFILLIKDVSVDWQKSFPHHARSDRPHSSYYLWDSLPNLDELGAPLYTASYAYQKDWLV